MFASLATFACSQIYMHVYVHTIKNKSKNAVLTVTIKMYRKEQGLSLRYPDSPSVLALARSRKKRVWGISSNIPCLAPGMQTLPQILITQSHEPQLLV